MDLYNNAYILINMTGRPRGIAFELYGYAAARHDGRVIAICRICNKTLQNTATKRLLCHRNVCSKESLAMLEEKNLSKSSAKNLIDTKTKDGFAEKKRQKNFEANFPEESSSICNVQDKHNSQYVEENSFSPANKSDFIGENIDDVEIEDEDTFLQKMRVGKQNKNRRIPPKGLRKRKLLLLEEEKTKAETLCYRKKGEYFQKQMENSDMQRKLMILQSQKLRLEIEKIRNGF